VQSKKNVHFIWIRGDFIYRPSCKGIAEHKKKSFYPSANLDTTKKANLFD